MRPEEAEAFGRLYDEHVWTVYGFFGYRVRTRQEAEDLTHATFERALKAWRTFDERRGSFRTWLMVIAKNLLVDHYRRDRSALHRPLDDLASLEDASPQQGAPEPVGVSPELETALATLTDREREVIALRFGGDLTGVEVARTTGLSVDNVHQILSRALRKLREQLGAGDAGPVAGQARRGSAD
jgi:RNA polymerase sigma-70 factor (ECF subfamily)